MIRTMIAGLLAVSVFTSAAGAAPPPPPPSLPEGTPETVDGYDTQMMYRSFIGWTQREAAKAIREVHEQQDLMVQIGGDNRALSFRVSGDWPYTDAAGGLEQQCDTDPDDIMGLITGTAGMTEEEIAGRCYWQLRVINGSGAKDLAQSWMGAGFDPLRAAAHLASLGIAPGTELRGKGVDWSGYQDPSAFRQAPVLRQRTYTSRSCEAFTESLKALEGLSLGNIDIDGFGTPSEIDYGIPHSPWLNVTVFSVNGGSKAEISFSGYAGMASYALNPVDAIIGSCEPVE